VPSRFPPACLNSTADRQMGLRHRAAWDFRSQRCHRCRSVEEPVQFRLYMAGRMIRRLDAKGWEILARLLSPCTTTRIIRIILQSFPTRSEKGKENKHAGCACSLVVEKPEHIALSICPGTSSFGWQQFVTSDPNERQTTEPIQHRLYGKIQNFYSPGM